MERTGFLVLSLGLTLGLAFAESSPAYDEVTGTGTVWAKGVGVNADGRIVGWYDANKNNIWDTPDEVDDSLCYAASASNLIAWGRLACIRLREGAVSPDLFFSECR